MIQCICDNCGKTLKDKPSQMELAADFKPEPRVTLVMEIQGKNVRPVDMDLCVSCAKKYVKVLKDPI